MAAKQNHVDVAAEVIARWRPYGMRVPPNELAGYVLDAVLPGYRRQVADECAAAVVARAGRDLVLTHEAAEDAACIVREVGRGGGDHG